MWDDGGGTLPDSFDLADIAAAALKFENDRVNYPTFTNSATHETNDKESRQIIITTHSICFVQRFSTRNGSAMIQLPVENFNGKKTESCSIIDKP